MAGTLMLSDFQINACGIAMLCYIAIVLGILAPKYLLAPSILRRRYGRAAGAVAGLLLLNLCIFTLLMPARPRVPFYEAFAGVFLSLCLSFLLCQRAGEQS
ncbi:hypothetical protein E5S69_04815 [Cupriavidus necator]|uniref:hypothetical protein n=1 Tax=Cupriavidus necator TaxID=106590 RepID=UPI00148FA510|nr:hypothetical protein [Cupriavidus necator]NOV22858.1 hypothetical protein [Cupriavidus necator]